MPTFAIWPTPRAAPRTLVHSRFAIHVLRQRWVELGFKYTRDGVWPVLARAELGGALLALRESDFDVYDWDRHEAWLSEDGAGRLVRAWTDDPHAVLGRAFVVTLDAERLYGGVFYVEGGAAALQFPVIHLLGTPVRGLRIRPSQGKTCDDAVPAAEEYCRAIADSRLLDWFRHCGLSTRR